MEQILQKKIRKFARKKLYREGKVVANQKMSRRARAEGQPTTRLQIDSEEKHLLFPSSFQRESHGNGDAVQGKCHQ